MNDRPTPETDAFSVKFKSVCGSKAWVPTDICRRFERERDEALSQIVQAECRAERFCQERDEAIADRDILRIDAQREAEHHDRMVSELEKVYKERDEARELNAKLFALADRATDDLRWFYESHADGISSELEKLKEAVK